MLSVPPEVTCNKEEMSSWERSEGQLLACMSHPILVVSHAGAGQVRSGMHSAERTLLCLPEGNVALSAKPNLGPEE